MSDNTQYHGAIRSPVSGNGQDMWTLSADTARLSEAFDEDVIWVDNIDALIVELSNRWPKPHPLASHLITGGNTVSVFTTPRCDDFEDLNPVDALDVVKTCGKVTLDGYRPTIACYIDKHDSLKNSVRLSRDDYNPTATFDPKVAKRNARARAAKTAQTPVSIHNIIDLHRDIRWKINEVLQLAAIGSGNTIDWICTQTLSAVSAFNMLFGPKAHRRLKSFQTLVKTWKERSHNNGDRFSCPASKRFSDWMDREVKARRASAIDTWTLTEAPLPK